MSRDRVLVLKQDGLRRFVEAEPAFAAIRAAHPGAHIDLITTQAFGRLAKGSACFDRVLAAGGFAERAAQKAFFGQLRKMRYGVVYDLDGTRATLDIRAALTGWRGPQWIGPKKVVSRPGRAQGFGGPVMRKLLEDAGVAVPHRLPDMGFATEARGDAANMRPGWFGIPGDFALLIPAYAPERRWPAEAWADLAARVAGAGVSPVLIGHETLAPFAHAVGRAVAPRAEHRGALVDLTGKADLAQIAMLAKAARFFVSNTAEELHLAAAVGCQGLAILHPQDVAASDALYGRPVVQMTAGDMADLDPGQAAAMLVSMGLLDGAPPAAGRGRASALNG